MHIAGRNGQLKMIQALLEEGGDPTQQSKVNLPPSKEFNFSTHTHDKTLSSS